MNKIEKSESFFERLKGEIKESIIKIINEARDVEWGNLSKWALSLVTYVITQEKLAGDSESLILGLSSHAIGLLVMFATRTALELTKSDLGNLKNSILEQ